MRPQLAALAGAGCIAWGLKQHYAAAGVDDLRWILAPTATMVGAAAGVTFEATPGEGFVSRERLFVIEKACAGINFMIAAFALNVLTLRSRIGSAQSAVGIVAASLAASYGATVIINAARIVAALWLGAQPLQAAGLSPADTHRLEGIAVYFAGLVGLYELGCRFSSRLRAADVPPLGAAAVVLLRRHAGRAARKRCGGARD
jgi:exosortase K